MYTLYGKKGSGSAAVQAALALLDEPFNVVETASWERNNAFADLLKLNPLGQIPTLVLPAGTAMSESAAILIHLGLAHPKSGLLPADASARAQAIRGLVFIAANCYAAISIIDYPERWCEPTDEGTQKRIRAGSRTRLHKHWEMFADLFSPQIAGLPTDPRTELQNDARKPAQPYLTGDRVGALDLLAAVVSKWSGSRPHLETHRPVFYAALMRVEAHPQVAAVFAQHWPAQ